MDMWKRIEPWMDWRLQGRGEAYGTATQDPRNVQGTMKVPWCTACVILLSDTRGLGLRKRAKSVVGWPGPDVLKRGWRCTGFDQLHECTISRIAASEREDGYAKGRGSARWNLKFKL